MVTWFHMGIWPIFAYDYEQLLNNYNTKDFLILLATCFFVSFLYIFYPLINTKTEAWNFCLLQRLKKANQFKMQDLNLNLVHGHMTSNNETVSRQMLWVGNIVKTMTLNGKQFTVTREMLTAFARDQRWPDVAGISASFSKFAFDGWFFVCNQVTVFQRYFNLSKFRAWRKISSSSNIHLKLKIRSSKFFHAYFHYTRVQDLKKEHMKRNTNIKKLNMTKTQHRLLKLINNSPSLCKGNNDWWG